MKVIICDNYEQIAKEVAKMVSDQINEKPDSVLGMATGTTPAGVYKELAKMYENGKLNMSEVKTFNLDEYYPMAADDEHSYHSFMNKHLFSKVNIRPENIHMLDGKCKNPKVECDNYEKKISECGGIDLQFLGFGQNGHIGFNNPDVSLEGDTHLTKLTQKALDVHYAHFENPEDAPTHALTMGLGTIMRSKKIVIMASGALKHRIVRRILKRNIRTDVPATILHIHPDVTLVCDRAAYEGVRIGVDLGGTEMKIGVVDDNFQILKKVTAPTPQGADADAVATQIAEKCLELMNDYNVGSIGIGTPGLIRNSKVSAVNLNFDNYDLAGAVKEKTGVTTYIANDANCAALAEAAAGAGRDVKNSVVLTLGTGVGGGIIFDGKIYEGKGSGGELGHFPIVYGGKKCGCGLEGCFEKYASTTALMEMATDAAIKNPDSLLAQKYAENQNKLNGLLFFEAVRENCPVANTTLDEYTDYLSAGINGLIYIFDPEKVIISGGISGAGDALLSPLKEKIKFDVPIVIAEHKNNAGLIGASLLH
ncbi:MAG: glucosamine-6-phosphate deaminase [Clostridia bacterium]|nr:glucosamine-6-phosphate deaminase [Clostridia bacterium]